MFSAHTANNKALDPFAAMASPVLEFNDHKFKKCYILTRSKRRSRTNPELSVAADFQKTVANLSAGENCTELKEEIG